MFTSRAAVVDIVTGKQLEALALPKMNVGDGVIHDNWIWEVTNVSVYKGKQIVYVARKSPANQGYIATLTWEQ